MLLSIGMKLHKEYNKKTARSGKRKTKGLIVMKIIKNIMLILVGVAVGVVLTTHTLQTTKVESNGQELDNALITINIFGSEQIYAMEK